MGYIKSRQGFIALSLALLVILIIAITSAVSIGAVDIQFDHVWKITANKTFGREIFTPEWQTSAENIVWQIRLPRVVLGVITGAGLAMSGIMMQALTRNPLADPYILGISSGASLGAVAAIIFGTSAIGVSSVSAAAFVGALISSILVFVIAQKDGVINTTRLILTGVAISALTSSMTNMIIYMADDSKVKSAVFWSTGSLGGAKWDNLLLPLISCIVVFVFLMVFSRALNGLLLGENAAITLGVDTVFLKRSIIVLSTLVTAFLVSITGTIGFVGLIVPHISRVIVGSDHKRVTIISILLGGILIVLSDLFARTIVSPEEIPIGIITAAIGAPFFIWMIRGKNAPFGGKS